MVFSSHVFLFYFLPLALVVYYGLPPRARRESLTAVSYLFYGWTNPLFVFLMLASTGVDYAAGRVMARSQVPGVRKRALVASVVSNLTLLAVFKYFNFGADSWDALMNLLGLPGQRLDFTFRVVLPLGISFYTFQSLSYTVDVYRRRVQPVDSFATFACYVSLFPQLVAGPIVRFSEVESQLATRSHTLTKFARGVAMFTLGLGKKVIIANSCGRIADTCFDAGSVDLGQAWLGATAFSFQIYFDFAGYSDMAIGLGLMLGFVFPKNFDSPYRAKSMGEYWRRWHLSLSTWLRDYLYLPLGGNRKGVSRTYVNVWIVMLLGGLWHGASWNFVIWGGLHAVLLTVERLRGGKALWARLPTWAMILATFTVGIVVRVPFRARDLSTTVHMWKSMVGLGDPQAASVLLDGVLDTPFTWLTLVVAAALTWGAPQAWDFTRRMGAPKAIVCLGVFWLSVALLTGQAYNPFIYFIF